MLRIERSFVTATLAAATLLATFNSNAGVVLSGTRVVFPADKRELSIRLQNQGDVPSLVQAWIDRGEGKPAASTAAAVPFAIRPPIFRIDGGRSQVLRIVHTGESMPQDRESLYYFNVLDVPANKTSAGSASPELRLIVRTQLKLFYRPTGLSAQAAANAPKQLQWSVTRHGQEWALEARNPTPYHVAISNISAGTKVKADIAAPLATTTYRLTQAQYNALGSQVTFDYTNDHGASHSVSAPLVRP